MLLNKYFHESGTLTWALGAPCVCAHLLLFPSLIVWAHSQIHGNMDVTALKGQTQKSGDCCVWKGRNEAGGDVKFYFHPLMLELSCKSNLTRTCRGDCVAAQTIPEHPPKHFLTFLLHFAFSLPCTKRISVSLWRGLQKVVNLVFSPAPINLIPGFNHSALPGHRSHLAKSLSQPKYPLLSWKGKKHPGRCWAEPRSHQGISSSFSSLC